MICLLDVLSESDMKDWVNITHDHICAVRGSSVVMPCSFTPPAGETATKVFWTVEPKEGGEPADLYENPSYTGRVEYYWDKNNNKNNCTLKLTDVKMTDKTGYRARIITDNSKWQSYSAVELSVTGDLSADITLFVFTSLLQDMTSTPTYPVTYISLHNSTFPHLDLTVLVTGPVIEGREVKLSCRRTCSLKAITTVIWRKNGKYLPVELRNNYELHLHEIRFTCFPLFFY